MKQLLFFGLCWLLVGCNLVLGDEPIATRPSILIASVTPNPFATVQSDTDLNVSIEEDYYDALPIMRGICFEAAWDASGQVFVLQSAQEHIQFYDLADNANLCRQPVTRNPFDFSTGDVLVGIWNQGQGCTASHTILGYIRDDDARTILITGIFSTEGDCNYDLVRGLWLGIPNAQGYDITMLISP